MKRKIVALTLAACAGLLCLGLAGCGESSTPDLEPAANLLPTEIDPGSIQDMSIDITSDTWTCEDGSGVYFTHGGNAGRTVTFVDADGNETGYCGSLEVTNDKHLKSTESSSEDIKVDFMFYDAFNVYDAVSETWYNRGDIAELNAIVAGKTFVQEGADDRVFTFNEDGSFHFECDGMTFDGDWSVINCENIIAGDDTEPEYFKFNFSENGTDIFDGYLTDWQGNKFVESK